MNINALSKPCWDRDGLRPVRSPNREGVQIEDGRLAPKTPIYSFHLGGKAYAVAHASIEGGRVFPLEEHPGRCVVLSRPRGSSLFRSTQAYVLPTEQAPRQGEVEEFVAQKTRAALDGADPLPGFDTYWCNWIAVNTDSRLLQ